MRVIAGTAKGHSLRAVKGLQTRPTLERVREALFNVLGSKVVDCVFLDLFSGTGAIGIEALSRGARLCYFNDKRRKNVEIIKQNLVRCRLQEKSEIYCHDALQLINYLQKENKLPVDLAYLDPPYEEGLYDKVLIVLAQSVLLKPNSLVIAETKNKTSLPEAFDRLILVRKGAYGDTQLYYYQYI